LLHPSDGEIVFVDKVKLEPATGGNVYRIVEDIFILRCQPASATNPNGENFSRSSLPPILFLDDVTFRS